MKRDLLAAMLFALGLAGCAAPARHPHRPSRRPGWRRCRTAATLAELHRWWAQFDDPLLARLIDAAETASPTIASAAARIADARARRAAAGAALLPSLDASASVGRGRQDVSLPVGTSESIGLQASWELDVFGRNRAARDAAGARLAGAQASWHDARVVVAAETANQYVALRACEALLAQARLDADSRAETARLTELSMQSGFESRANAALTRASAAQGLVGAKQQGEQCEQDVKALVALTGIAEPELRAQLGSAGGAPARAGGDRRAERSGSGARAAARRLRARPRRRRRQRRHRRSAGGAVAAHHARRQRRRGAVRLGPRLVQRHDLEHRPGRRQPAGVRRRRAPRQRRRRARPLRRGGEQLRGDPARRDPRRRERAHRPAGNRRPQRRRADRRRQLRGLVPRHRGALQERLRHPVRARGRAAQRPGGAEHADRPAPRARRRLDRPLPRPRRRLVAHADERTAATFQGRPATP